MDAAAQAVAIHQPREIGVDDIPARAKDRTADSRPGLTLNLLDGKYTPKNRPIQDLVTFYEIGRRELRLNWPALLANVDETPVEPIQTHYMRVAPPRGQLAKTFTILTCTARFS